MGERDGRDCFDCGLDCNGFCHSADGKLNAKPAKFSENLRPGMIIYDDPVVEYKYQPRRTETQDWIDSLRELKKAEAGDRKDYTDKLDYECFSWEAMEELAKVFREAKKKYGNSDSWKLSGTGSLKTYMSALQRHLNEIRKIVKGKKGCADVYTEIYKGKEFTWRHSAQLIWNAMVICDKMLEKENEV